MTLRTITIKHGLIFILAGLLITYHVVTTYQLYANFPDFSNIQFIQFILKIAVALSLCMVIWGSVTGRKWVLWVMWISILSLIASQYWLHFNPQSAELAMAEALSEKSVFSYLRGLIFPSAITLLFPGRKS
ncbi:hypothetical protein KCG44_14100 [Pacificimonas sp. WHA3]|uniref:Uncharacterized protein n=1 Tax=Pacificimonas pallii TaxID=2827236 RepID=A0ABS6SHM1_9SPHN|nr:hypothetical protein [Pacificimonas pallii]MBV7257914.1 hypothetical protein [Pacificimonas pallii]